MDDYIFRYLKSFCSSDTKWHTKKENKQKPKQKSGKNPTSPPDISEHNAIGLTKVNEGTQGLKG